MENLNKSNFDVTVSKGLHLVDFWAEWCGPCRMQTPILEELSKEYKSGEIKISKVNVDNEPELAMKFGVQSIPTMLIIKNGELVDRLVGVRMKDALKTELQKFI